MYINVLLCLSALTKFNYGKSFEHEAMRARMTGSIYLSGLNVVTSLQQGVVVYHCMSRSTVVVLVKLPSSIGKYS